MVTTADRVIVELETKLDRYSSKVDQAVRQWSSATSKMGADAKRAEEAMSRSMGSIRSTLLATASVLTTAVGVSALARLADQYTRFTNQLRLSGLEGASLAGIQNELYTIAQRQGVPLEALGTLYGRVAQSAGELGASQQQLLQFTAGVAAALRIQGGDAAASSGALLQLSQALGGSIVRAEEFNSINEGARPILVAVANGIEKYRGSVARLRNDVIAGRVSSRQLFEGFLRGSAQLEQQAARSNLTIGQSLTILNNAFTKYIGEVDQAHGATQRVSQALQLVANNLNVLIPALVQIALLMGGVWLGRFAAGLVAASAATGAVSAAMFALQARALGAATSMEALAFAGRAAGASLLSAFGGYVGLAVLAFAAGMYLVATATDEATDSVNRNIEAAGEGAERYRTLFNEAKRAREANERLGTASATTGAAGLDTMAASAGNLEAAMRQMGMTAQWATFQAARATLADAGTRLRSAIENNDRARATPGAGGSMAEASTRRELREAIAFARDSASAGREAAAELREGRNRRNPRATAAPAAGGGRKRRGRQGPDPDDITRRFENERAALEQQILEIAAQLVNSRQARLDAELAGIEADRARAEREIEGNDNYSDARKAELKVLNDRVAGIRRDVAAAEETDARRADVFRAAAAQLDGELELAQITSQMADTMQERRASALELLRLSQARERLDIEAALLARGLNDTDRQILLDRQRQLDRVRDASIRQIDREHEGPRARYLRELRNGVADVNGQIEEIEVRSMQALDEATQGAIKSVLGLHGALGDIVSDLIMIFVRQQALALFDGSGGGVGGILGSIGSLFGGGKVASSSWDQVISTVGGLKGLANGGSFMVGGKGGVDRNTLSINGQPRAMVSGSERITVTPQGKALSGFGGQAMAPGGGAQPIARVELELSGDIDGRIASISGPVAVEIVRRAAPQIVSGAKAETIRAIGRPRLNRG